MRTTERRCAFASADLEHVAVRAADELLAQLRDAEGRSHAASVESVVPA